MNNNNNPRYWNLLYPQYDEHLSKNGQLYSLYKDKYGNKSKNIITNNIYEEGVDRLHERASRDPAYMNKFYGLYGIPSLINMMLLREALHDEIIQVIKNKKNKKNGKAYGTFLKGTKQNSGPGRLGAVDVIKGRPANTIRQFLSSGPNGQSNAFKNGFRNVTTRRGGKNKKRVTRKRIIKMKKTKYSRKHKK